MKKAKSLSEFMSQLLLRKGPFLVVFFVVMLLSYAFLYAIDFIPEAPEADKSEEVEEQEEERTEEPVAVSNAAPLPLTIHFDSLQRVVSVQNPVSRKIDDLDASLLKGAVRHPDSANFANTGNIFILGHSSYLPNVFNKNYQAFNGIQDLNFGDIVRLRSADTEYIYRVERVYKAKASDVVVPNSRGEAKLTLATCNTFGAKEDRFMVEASLVSQKAL
ncbi:MAG: sortase [Candidatus Paceibacterota bacterium]